MGYELVNEVLTHWAGLSPAARVTAMALAVRALDTPSGDTPARTYWGGHDQLIFLVYGIPADDEDPRYLNAKRQMTRHIRELKEAGFLAVERPAYSRGTRPRYVILRSGSRPADDPARPRAGPL